ncbi:MAG: Trk family potassium uptake protein [Lachnospiraceae bacterium]|nr:Trk family potassium uptake protein [Lachnospiraceae bacterium]
MKLCKTKLTQTQIIALGFLLMIVAGGLLLMLPISSKSGEWTSFSDALFTSTSATCVTGLIVRDTFRYWSLFGQLVILVLIQIGGLGFMTIATLFSLMLRRKIGLKERELLHESVSTLHIGGIVKLTKRILIGTCLFEGIGAILLSIRFIPQLGIIKGIYNAIFHSVSAFCNAGFDLMGRYEEYSSLTAYAGDPIINITIMVLIVIGGIGFLVWEDVLMHKLKFRKYRLHSKIVLTMTALLVFGGAILFFLFENNKLMADMTMKEKIFSSLFSSVTARTAGFNTIDTAGLSQSSKLLTIILMFIGGSPGSTAGGIKTTTFFVIALYVLSSMRHENGCNIFGRRIEPDAIRRAASVFATNLFLALSVTLVICGIQSFNLVDVLFETFSAIGTVGMSTGITRDLEEISRMLIVFLMYCGRVGSLSFALAFTERKIPSPLQQPVEKITIG